jgi:hypothetical protein
MAGFGLDPFQVDFGRLFYVGTEITIVIKVIKKLFTIIHHKPRAHDHGTTMRISTDHALLCCTSGSTKPQSRSRAHRCTWICRKMKQGMLARTEKQSRRYQVRRVISKAINLKSGTSVDTSPTVLFVSMIWIFAKGSLLPWKSASGLWLNSQERSVREKKTTVRRRSSPIPSQ